MLPVNIGGHSAYQDTFVSEFLKFYPDPFSLSKSTWDYICLLYTSTSSACNVNENIVPLGTLSATQIVPPCAWLKMCIRDSCTAPLPHYTLSV